MSKKTASNITKKYSRLNIIFSALSILVTLGPVLFYIVKGFVEADLTQEKVTLTCMLLISIILVAVNMLMKLSMRSTTWFIVLGVYCCLDNIMPLLLMIATGTIIDEMVLTPLKKTFKEKRNINREIDKRI